MFCKQSLPLKLVMTQAPITANPGEMQGERERTNLVFAVIICDAVKLRAGPSCVFPFFSMSRLRGVTTKGPPRDVTLSLPLFLT